MTVRNSECWAWVTTYPDGVEGFVGMLIGDKHMPMCACKRELIDNEGMRAIAISHLEHTGQPVRLVCFSNRRVIEEIVP